MSYLVGNLVLNSGDKVIIRWTDGTETKAVYKDTYGYNHFFDAIPPTDKEIRLSNHFMRLKGIKIRKDEE
ncbi:MAG: hypothetical protein IKM22_01910 [Clostridia bacterium]|nr:hypothetical protein [Clostridia bacterium]